MGALGMDDTALGGGPDTQGWVPGAHGCSWAGGCESVTGVFPAPTGALGVDGAGTRRVPDTHGWGAVAFRGGPWHPWVPRGQWQWHWGGCGVCPGTHGCSQGGWRWHLGGSWHPRVSGSGTWGGSWHPRVLAGWVVAAWGGGRLALQGAHTGLGGVPAPMGALGVNGTGDGPRHPWVPTAGQCCRRSGRPSRVTPPIGGWGAPMGEEGAPMGGGGGVLRGLWCRRGRRGSA